MLATAILVETNSGASVRARRRRSKNDEIALWMYRTCRVGDVVFSGGRDTCSRLIQRLTQSPYSHVGVVTDIGVITEAYDYSFTLSELDDGVYATTFDVFVARSSRLARVSVYRLVDDAIDAAALRETAVQLHHRPAPYPTIGGIALLIALAVGRAATSHSITRRLTPSGRAVRAQARFWGDGVTTMHCGELATRLLVAAGVDIRFGCPLLLPYIDAADNRPLPSVAVEPAPARLSSRCRAGGPRLRAAVDALGSLMRRLRCTEPIDFADFILPSDLARSEPLAQLVTLFIDPFGGLSQQRSSQLHRSPVEI